MPYGEVVSRTFSVWWRHRYLWILGMLGGGSAGGSCGGNFGNGGNFNNGGPNNGQPPDIGAAGANVAAWLSDHPALLVTLGIIWLVIVIVLFLLSCLTTGALIEATAWHDGDQPYGFRQAWSAGRRAFGRVLRVKLIQLVLFLVPIALVAVLVIAAAAQAARGGSPGPFVASAMVLGLPLIAWFIVGGVVFELALRSAVLDRAPAGTSLGNGFRLLGRRFWRLALLWLILVALGIGIGIVIAIVFVIAAIPLVAIVFGAYQAAQTAGAVIAGVIAGLIALAILWLFGGAASALNSVYWTLAYRRLDYEAPQPAYPQQPYSAPPAPPA
jgi:hypothetical protein